MKSCIRCGSYAINPGHYGRNQITDLDLCDVCYWRKRHDAQGLTIATLCDIVLGENAGDRSDDALIRGVRRLIDGGLKTKLDSKAFTKAANDHFEMLAKSGRPSKSLEWRSFWEGFRGGFAMAGREVKAQRGK